MFGNVISVSDLTIKLENTSKRVETSLLAVHIVFENKYKIDTMDPNISFYLELFVL